MATSTWIALALALVAPLVLLAACGDDGGRGPGGVEIGTPAVTIETGGKDAEAVKAAVRETIDAWNAGDVERFLAAFTEQGVRFEFGVSREEATQLLADRVGDPPLAVDEIVVNVVGDSASAASTFYFGRIGGLEALSLVRREGRWRIQGSTFIPADLPPSAVVVELELTEYSFDFDPAQVSGGDFVFQAVNAGQEEHEVVLASIPEDLDLEAAVNAPELPPEVEVLGFVGPIRPGDATTIRFKDQVPAGRYALLCFVESADGTPHARLGMYADFTLEQPAGPTPKPPAP